MLLTVRFDQAAISKANVGHSFYTIWKNCCSLW